MQQLLLTSGIIIVLIALWTAVQALVRRNSNMAPGTDVLACRMCAAGGLCTCGLKPPEEGTDSTNE
jgi:hypothetical protein